MSQHIMLISRHRHRASVRRRWSDPGDIVQYVIEVASRLSRQDINKRKQKRLLHPPRVPHAEVRLIHRASINLLSKVSDVQECRTGAVSRACFGFPHAGTGGSL
jgi:hypothetical protein